jgi:glyoxylase-like metal-dependent hydrolase (beta-lactamase superfamily II)
MPTDYPTPDRRKLLESQRRQALRLANEAAEVLSYHDLQRPCKEANLTIYHDLVQRIDEELATLT